MAVHNFKNSIYYELLIIPLRELLWEFYSSLIYLMSLTAMDHFEVILLQRKG